MKERTFQPLLAPNQAVDLKDVTYPCFASTKYDGMRVLFYKGKILTRSLKPLPNKQLNILFEPLRQFSEDLNLCLDGEIYSHELTFQEIISYCMTDDFEDKKSIKKYGEVKQIPSSLKFYCFDYIEDDNFAVPFSKRYTNTLTIDAAFPRIATRVYHKLLNSPEEVEKYFEEVLEDGYEGLMLRNPNEYYKFGRATLKEKIIWKCKKFQTFENQITDVIQATRVDENAEKTINEKGYSVTSKKKDDRILINKASAFMVMYEGKELKVTLAMSDTEKEEVWKNKESYINKYIEYKGMLIGAKEVPRHAVFVRFRNDKDN